MVFELRLSLTPRLQPGVAALTPALSRFNGFSDCNGKPLKRLRFLHPKIHRAEAAVLMRKPQKRSTNSLQRQVFDKKFHHAVAVDRAVALIGTDLHLKTFPGLF